MCFRSLLNHTLSVGFILSNEVWFRLMMTRLFIHFHFGYKNSKKTSEWNEWKWKKWVECVWNGNETLRKVFMFPSTNQEIESKLFNQKYIVGDGLLERLFILIWLQIIWTDSHRTVIYLQTTLIYILRNEKLSTATDKFA